MRAKLVALAFLMCGGASHVAGADEVADRPLSYDQFRSMPYERREQLIATLGPDEQLDAFISMQNESEPPDLGLAWVIASTGEPLVDAAEARLRSDRGKRDLSDTLFLLWVINREGYSNVRGHIPLMNLLETLVRETKSDPMWRSNAESLQGIRSLAPRGRSRTR